VTGHRDRFFGLRAVVNDLPAQAPVAARAGWIVVPDRMRGVLYGDLSPGGYP